MQPINDSANTSETNNAVNSDLSRNNNLQQTDAAENESKCAENDVDTTRPKTKSGHEKSSRVKYTLDQIDFLTNRIPGGLLPGEILALYVKEFPNEKRSEIAIWNIVHQNNKTYFLKKNRLANTESGKRERNEDSQLANEASECGDVRSKRSKTTNEPKHSSGERYTPEEIRLLTKSLDESPAKVIGEYREQFGDKRNERSLIRFINKEKKKLSSEGVRSANTIHTTRATCAAVDAQLETIERPSIETIQTVQAPSTETTQTVKAPVPADLKNIITSVIDFCVSLQTLSTKQPNNVL
jgi:hypothetical protein